MYTQLTIQERLWDARKDRGLTLAEVSEATGIPTSTIQKYEDTRKSSDNFTLSQVMKLAEFYGLTMDYVCGFSENREPPNSELRELHLDDQTLHWLREGSFNHRLLCELLCHPDFRRFLEDLEIYVDGHMSLQIQNMNETLEAVRTLIIERYHPEEDVTLKEMKEVQITEDDYFTDRLGEDIGGIARDLKEKHAKDLPSAPAVSTAHELIQEVLEIADSDTNRIEKLTKVFCRRAQINFNSLSVLEQATLLGIASKSGLAQAGQRSNRGRRKKKKK